MPFSYHLAKFSLVALPLENYDNHLTVPLNINASFQSVLPEKVIMIDQVDAWQEERNNQEKNVDWQFSIAQTRVKLKRLCPTILSVLEHKEHVKSAKVVGVISNAH